MNNLNRVSNKFAFSLQVFINIISIRFCEATEEDEQSTSLSLIKKIVIFSCIVAINDLIFEFFNSKRFIRGVALLCRYCINPVQ